MPLISVIVPCYNQAQYLDECLQSVLDQTYTDWECIIVNDGSPDHTEEIAKKWVEKDARFRYLSKENGGLSSARNAGIEIAKGEWILPLDADDKIGERYLELAEKEFENDYKVIYCTTKFFGAKQGEWKLADFSLNTLAKFNILTCTSFYKKDNWEKVGGYDILLLGTSTWGDGELQDDWYDAIKTVKTADLNGKIVALFGCGDSESYCDTFCDGMGVIYDQLKNSGCTFVGAVPADEYSYSSSIAVIDGKFVGLALDDVNESGKTEERINNWIEEIKKNLLHS